MSWDIERVPVQKDVLEYREKMIENLQMEIQESGELSRNLTNELAHLRNEKEQLQEEYNKLVKHQYHQDYTIENQKKRIEDIGKTLELYTRENKAMRELLRQWI